jgi:hypothetical protein
MTSLKKRRKKMNINDSIWKYADKLGLGWACTGGGCDFISRDVYTSAGHKEDGHHYELILSSQEDIGCSPDKLNEPSCVSIYAPGSGWMESIIIPFPTARVAMNFMAREHQMFTNMGKDDRQFQEFLFSSGLREGEMALVQAFLKGHRAGKVAAKGSGCKCNCNCEPDKKTYEVEWKKGYFCAGTEKIEATSREDAESIMLEQLGDMSGSLQYDDSSEGVEVIREIT